MVDQQAPQPTVDLLDCTVVPTVHPCTQHQGGEDLLLNEFRLDVSVLDQVCRLLGEFGQGIALQQHRFQIDFG
ncbi:hypothetical protein [Streptomyces albus]|uniref:hypothetical protein n=1 Tax=Streptomyces albus TaxID=1888 RepID=UPI0033C0325B